MSKVESFIHSVHAAARALAVLAPLVTTVALTALAGCSSEAPIAKSARDADEKTACIGGLCVKPDHVVARKTLGARSRCLVVAWDGTDSLPPTAHVSAVDDAPGARPGVFAAIDMPAFREGYSYPIAADPATASPGSASVFSVRVDPAVRFADERIADGGDVKVVKAGDGERIVVVNTRWSDGSTETASFVVPKAYNGCSSPADL